jgi:hypothetical protein
MSLRQRNSRFGRIKVNRDEVLTHMWHIAKRLLGEEPESKKVAEAL